MPLQPGTTLGPYSVTAKIGEGGMGQVYQATDTKLNRQVALKILPEAFASDPDRLARFQREAQVLASLNHPNIAAIHGLEDSEGTKALVLELVEGPTLADRIAQGPIPVDEALPIAKQIAEALEAAHEAGVIHRDLKPANIKVREDGTVKVLDFGLAKALDTTPEGDPSLSPTLTAAATQMGVIMGTAAYMSPEQAAGKPVDRRGDIWSFGVVLFEMLTGKRLFMGERVSHVLGAVLQVDPNWEAPPTQTPQPVKRLLSRCLNKDRKQRLQHIGDARVEITDVLAAPPRELVAPGAPRARSNTHRPWQLATVVLSIATILLYAQSQGGSGSGTDASLPRQISRTVVDLPVQVSLFVGAGAPLIGFESPALALSPDGSQLVYVGRADSSTRLYHRDLDSFAEPRPLLGTEGALYGAV